MTKGTEIAGDVVTSSSALAGLILVYIGSLSASFGAYQPQEKRGVARSFQRRAWFAFIGLILFVLSVGLAIVGKWLDSNCMAIESLVLLLIALVWVLITAVLTVLEIG